jgi:ABC-type amino acid transport system permease subunit
VLDADRAFDGSAYSALRWAYAPLAGLGALFAVVALALQLLVIAARRRERRIAHVVMRRTGFGRRHLWLASVVETGLPLLAGALTGVGAAVLAASLAVERLDPMPGLAPPAQFAMPWSVLAVVACAIPLWTAVIAAAIVRSTTAADPMTVMQGAV